MANHSLVAFRVNQKILKFVFIVVIVLGAFLFLAPKQAEAAKGYGWMGPNGMWPWRLGTCWWPYDSDVILYIRDSVTNGNVNASFIEGQPIGRPPTVGSGVSLAVPCWDPTSGIFIKVAASGYRDFHGGIKWYNDDPRGKIAKLIVHMTRSSGSCEEDCPSIETVEPTGSGSIDWFYDRPATWEVRGRLLPFDPYGSDAIDDWLFQLTQTSGCCYPGFAGYLDWGVN